MENIEQPTEDASYNPYEKYPYEAQSDSTHEVKFYNPYKDIGGVVYAASYEEAREIKKEFEAGGLEEVSVSMTDLGRSLRSRSIGGEKEIGKNVKKYK